MSEKVFSIDDILESVRFTFDCKTITGRKEVRATFRDTLYEHVGYLGFGNTPDDAVFALIDSMRYCGYTITGLPESEQTVSGKEKS